MRKNAPLEASNVAVLLEHIPIGSTRSVHSLQVERVEADHYKVDGGPVIDLVDAVAQIGSYSGKHSNPNFKQHMAKLEEDLREARDALGVFKLSGDEEERAEFGLKALTKADLVLREASHVEHSGRATPMSAHSAAFKYRDEANEISNYIYPRLRKVLEKHAGELRSYPNPNKLGPQMKLKPGALQRYAAKIDAFDEEYGHWGYLPDSASDADDLYDDLRHMAQHFDLTDHEQEVLQILIKRLRKYVEQEHNPNTYKKIAGLKLKPGALDAYAAQIDEFDAEHAKWGYLPDSWHDAQMLAEDLLDRMERAPLNNQEKVAVKTLLDRVSKYVDQEHNPGLPAKQKLGSPQMVRDALYGLSESYEAAEQALADPSSDAKDADIAVRSVAEALEEVYSNILRGPGGRPLDPSGKAFQNRLRRIEIRQPQRMLYGLLTTGYNGAVASPEVRKLYSGWVPELEQSLKEHNPFGLGLLASAAKGAANLTASGIKMAAKGAKQAYADVQYARSKKKGKKSNPHVEQRGYFYEVLNSAGNVVAMTTNKEEAQDVCDNPKQLGLPKSEYTFRHVGGKGLIPRTQAGNRARRVK